MDQIISVIRRCFPLCFPLSESEDQDEASQVVVIEDPNNDVQSNSTTRSTSLFSESGLDHDVFLSFRGEDTRKNFTDHLYSALKRVGISTFRDDEGLDKGENISSELLNAIRTSRISIVVFSKSYASSRWCLDELAEIVHRKNTIGHTLLPIFFHVEPLDVRKQSGTFAEAFAKHEERFPTDRVQRWREALTQAAECSGWDLKSFANGYESRFIKNIVEEVLHKVNPTCLDVAKHPIGMESRVDSIKDILNLETNDVRILGIYGMGGVGKTTLAKAVYNEIWRGAFDGCSFLSNVKEMSQKLSDIVDLQEKLLNDILKTNLKIDNVDRGISIIKERLHGKKVLVILDDVDDFQSLHSLVEKQWFGLGSRIIVTTRDEHLLSQLEVDEKYKVEELNHWESLRLFNWHAFKMYNPKAIYSELSFQAVCYAGGLPLALITLGSFLKGRSIAEWKSKLENLERTPDVHIQKILRISFDSLDPSTQGIFLDIACFFVGMDKEYAIKILDDCNLSSKIDISILNERSLVTNDDQNKLKMHNLIQDMGRKIVCEESPKYPGKRSRLWFHKDVLNVLHNCTGSKRVEGLILNLPEQLNTKAFRKMKILRLLQINDVHLMGSYEHLSKELKWLCWHKCPLKFLPQDFHLESLVILDMQHSYVKRVWKTKKVLNKLKVLNLSNSKNLSRSPDFSEFSQLEIIILEGCTSLVQVHESIGYLKSLVSLNLENCRNLKDLPKFLQAPHLESLNLKDCTSLVEIHQSIGLLKRLVLLNLQGCENLRNLPSSISNLESLKTLVLSRCFNLEKLPNQLGNMRALTMLYLENTIIKHLPSSFCLLSNLKTLSFHGCECLIELPKFLQTSHLETLTLEGCTSLVKIHESIGLLKRLVLLNLQCCKKLRSLPSSISNLESLESLDLWECYNVEELPEQLGNMTALKKLNVGLTAVKQLPSSFNRLKNLEDLSFFRCECLIKSPEFSETSHLKKLTFEGCTSLVNIHESIGHLKRLESLDLKRCKKLRSLPISSISNLESLRFLILSNCSKFDKLPKQWGNMKALWKLAADGTAIKQLSSSFGDLSNLCILTLPGCGGPCSSWISPNSSNRVSLLSIFELSSLTELDLSDRNLCEDEFPEFECLSSLERLYLSRNNFRNLPICISRLPKLKYLYLSECTSLQSISLPRSVILLVAKGCTSLERLSILANESSGSSDLRILHEDEKMTSDFYLDNCRKLVEIQNLERLRCVPSNVQMGSCNNLSSEFRESVLQMMCKADIVCTVLLPGSEIPNWISHQAMGSSVSFRVPPFLDGKMGKGILCIVYAVNKEAPRDILYEVAMFRWRLCNKSSRDQSNNWDDVGRYTISGASDFDIFEDHILAQVSDRIKMKSGDEIEVAIDLQMWGRGSIDNSIMCGIDPQIMEVKRCGIHFVVDDDELGVVGSGWAACSS